MNKSFDVNWFIALGFLALAGYGGWELTKKYVLKKGS